MYFEFVVDLLTMTEFSPQRLRLSPVRMNPTNLRTHLFITEANH